MPIKRILGCLVVLVLVFFTACPSCGHSRSQLNLGGKGVLLTMAIEDGRVQYYLLPNLDGLAWSSFDDFKKYAFALGDTDSAARWIRDNNVDARDVIQLGPDRFNPVPANVVLVSIEAKVLFGDN